MKHHSIMKGEKLSRALTLYEQGLPNFAIAERLGLTVQQAARTIIQAKKRRDRAVSFTPAERP